MTTETRRKWSRQDLYRMADVLACYKTAAKLLNLEIKRVDGHDENGDYYHGFSCGSFGLCIEGGRVRGEYYTHCSGSIYEPPSTDVSPTGDDWVNTPEGWEGAIAWLVRSAHGEALDRALEIGGETCYARYWRRDSAGFCRGT